jgi:acetyl-CoA acyltransferase 1
MSIQHLKIPFEKVNPVGGAIAMGHPLGATGARQIATGFAEAKREKKKIFVTSMCIGSGMVSASTSMGSQFRPPVLVASRASEDSKQGRGKTRDRR